MARLPKDFLPQMFGSVREKAAENAVAPHYLAGSFSSALKPGLESETFFCHISWRQAHGSHTRAKRGKKAMPRYVAGPFAPLCCVYSGFGGIPAILSGGNPPRYKTNHTDEANSLSVNRAGFLRSFGSGHTGLHEKGTDCFSH